MALERAVLIALRARVEALRASSCDMAHESIPDDPDGDPKRSARSPSGFARVGLCLDAARATNLGCSHTMARYVLCDAVLQILGDGDEAVLAALHDLEQAISLLDHRRYDAERRRASARLAKADGAQGEREIAALVAEHRACVRRAGELRDGVLRRIDDARAVWTSASKLRRARERKLLIETVAGSFRHLCRGESARRSRGPVHRTRRQTLLLPTPSFARRCPDRRLHPDSAFPSRRNKN
jgi:hypothetical protein